MKPIDIGDLTAATGVSARTLYYGIKQHRGASPKKYLKGVRLLKRGAACWRRSFAAHALLKSPPPSVTKTRASSRATTKTISGRARARRCVACVSP